MATGFETQKCDSSGAPCGQMVATGIRITPEDLDQALARIKILEKHYQWFDELAARYGQPPPHPSPDGGVHHYGLNSNGELIRWEP